MEVDRWYTDEPDSDRERREQFMGSLSTQWRWKKNGDLKKKNINGFNDLSASENIRPDMFSYACKIPCSEGKNNGQFTKIINVRVPNIKIPVFLAQHRPERDRNRIQNMHPFILDS